MKKKRRRERYGVHITASGNITRHKYIELAEGEYNRKAIDIGINKRLKPKTHTSEASAFWRG